MPIPPAAQARTRLEERLAQRPSRRRVVQPVAVPQWAVMAFTTMTAVIAVAWLLAVDPAVPPPRVVEAVPVFLLPKTDLTPGLATPLTAAELCGHEGGRRTQPVSTAVRDTVFAAYGADVRRSSAYELDYLITPELGGVADVRNLWPQAFAGTEWNAYVKDELELHLHQLVCAGAVDVATAQKEMATDWIASYKRRFDTISPRRDYAARPLTHEDTEFLRAELAELGVEAPVDRADGTTMLALLQTVRGDAAISSNMRP